MVKRLKAMADKKKNVGAGLFDSALASSVKDSAKEIWLAGMGAFAKAQEEGTKVFEALVKEGVSLQRKTQAVAEERIGEVTGKMSAMAGEVTNKAGASWDKLESIFEARTAKAMGKLGVPTAKDVADLSQRVDALAAAVAQLGGKMGGKTAAVKKPAAGAAAKQAAAKAPPGRAVAKKAAVRKVAPPPVVAELPAAAAPASPAKRAPRRPAAKKVAAAT